MSGNKELTYQLMQLSLVWMVLAVALVVSARVDYIAIDPYIMHNTTMWKHAASLPVDLFDSTYTIDWSAEALSPTIGAVIEVRLMRDNLDVLSEFALQASTGWVPANGFYMCVLSQGMHTFDIHFRSQIDGVDVYLRRARIRVEDKDVVFAPGTMMSLPDMTMKKKKKKVNGIKEQES